VAALTYAGRALGPAIVVAGLAVAACYLGPGTDHFVDVLDEIEVPAGWTTIETERHGPGEALDCDPIWPNAYCPSAIRHYTVDDDLMSGYDAIREAVEGAGFEVIPGQGPPDCQGLEAAACGFTAVRGEDSLNVSVLQPGVSINYRKIDQVTAQVTALRK
jgi:hypothetical protein